MYSTYKTFVYEIKFHKIFYTIFSQPFKN